MKTVEEGKRTHFSPGNRSKQTSLLLTGLNFLLLFSLHHEIVVLLNVTYRLIFSLIPFHVVDNSLIFLDFLLKHFTILRNFLIHLHFLHSYSD